MTRTGRPIRPVVIAHRGASGYLPEHTLPAKALAYTMGADYLEQDVVATRDDELVVLHDIHLDRVTDVAALYPDRHRQDGRYYVRDFSLDEIAALTVHERTNADGSPVYPNRFTGEGESFRVHTFREELAFVAELQSGDGHAVGVYPEIKRPAWHKEEGVDIAPIFLEQLGEFGYVSHSDPIYLQCFDDRELIRIRTTLGCEMKLVQLIGENSWGEAATDYAELQSPAGLARLAKSVDGIGPWINQLYRQGDDGWPMPTELVRRAHDVGLAVHPYTFRQDDLPPGFETMDALIEFAVEELAVDGFFTDFPDIGRRALQPHK